ncbi:trypsin-like serine protease [Fontivita pretiosa]|uniref:trypsin-like serine protease n=1 Tax=Fontivita pretiosa TaxID=2989684 RepID=UPI003D166E2E
MATAVLVGASGPAALLSSPAVLLSPALAGTIRHDRSDSSYTALGNDPKYQAVGAFPTEPASGVLIAPKWVLAAGHSIADGGDFQFNIGGTTSSNGQTYTAAQAFVEPSYSGDISAGNDIALVRLNSAVAGVVPASRFFDANEVGMIGTTVGYGMSGTGLSGQSTPFGTRRGIQNTIDALGTLVGWNNRMALSDFDDPSNADGLNSMGSTTPQNLEGLAALGDSGSGTYVEVNGRWYLAGITSFVAAFDPPAGDGTGNSSYSDAMGWIRVSRHNVWIDDQIAHTWNSASGGSFNTAGNWALGPTALNGVPGAGDIVGLRNPGTYTITFGSAVTNHQLVARGGNVTLNLGGSVYTLTSSMFEGAITVGRYSGNDASLTFTNGVINTTGDGEVNLAEQSGSFGRLTIGAATTMNVAGSVYVGGTFRGAGGAATLTLASASSQLNIARTLRIWGGGSVNYNGGSLSAGTLDVAGGKLILTSGANKVLRTGALAVTGTGRIDLADNDMIASSANLAAVTTLIKNGLTNGGAFDWNGFGIGSSKAGAENTARGSFLFALGVIRNDLSQVGGSGPIYTSFSGIGVTGNEILIKYTYFGDADLSGRIDATDYSLIDNGYVNRLTGWINGDFDYSGVIDATDYALIDNAYVNQSGPLAQAMIAEHARMFGGEYLAALRAIQSGVIPEPAMLAASALIAWSLKRPRRACGRG